VQARDYVMLSPLDTAALPAIPDKDYGGNVVRSALEGDGMWQSTLKRLQRHQFSDESVYKTMVMLYRHTHKHYVTFPVAYWSADPQGDSLLVSGRVYLPKRRYLNGIVLANHYTITSDVEAPSNMLSMESVLAMKGYAVILPDYVGYGLSRDEVHPYLHWRSAARTAVDLLNGMPALLAHYGYSYPKDVVISGYSQGGAVALGVARMLEEMDTDWTIRKLYAGAGPYDPAATYVYSVERDTMGIPAAIPLIVMGLSDAYGLEFDLEDYFLEPLLSHYDEWVLSKECTVKQINDLMGSIVMSELMTPESLDMDSPLAEMLYEMLSWNSNVGYDLQSPAYFLHSLDDEVVPLINSENLIAEMPDDAHISYDLGHYGSHMEASVAFMKYVYKDL
jgi:pimeloyl-ACP methyl ester carboxylesterase